MSELGTSYNFYLSVSSIHLVTRRIFLSCREVAAGRTLIIVQSNQLFHERSGNKHNRAGQEAMHLFSVHE